MQPFFLIMAEKEGPTAEWKAFSFEAEGEKVDDAAAVGLGGRRHR
jgi:hypothetical protein